MFPMQFDVKETGIFEKMERERALGVIKKAIKQALEYWHKKYASIHFTRGAYVRYPDVYKKRKRKGGLPLVITGALRDRILHAGRYKITGKRHSATVELSLKYGRPPQYTAQYLREQTFVIMKLKKVSFKHAQKMVYSTAGYSPESKKSFQEMISAINDQEKEHLVKLVKEEIVSEMKKSGGRRRRKVTA